MQKWLEPIELSRNIFAIYRKKCSASFNSFAKKATAHGPNDFEVQHKQLGERNTLVPFQVLKHFKYTGNQNENNLK